MSVATQISRLQTAKADIKTAIEDKGVAVPSSAKIDVYDDYIRAIATNETIVINLTTNQNSSYNSDLIGATVTITNNTESTTVLSTTWNGTAIQQEIEAGVSYTVSVGSRTGYKTPSSVTYTSKVGIRNLTFQYKTEVITVTVNTDVSGVTAQGQVITINGVNTTIPASGVVSQKVAFDTAYTVSLNSKSGYSTPASLSYTANSVSRSATMTYKKLTDGVFAVTTNGAFVPYADIDTSSPSSYIGVAVVDTSKDVKYFFKKNIPTGSSKSASVANYKFLLNANYKTAHTSYLPKITGTSGSPTIWNLRVRDNTRTNALTSYNNGERGTTNTTNLVNDTNLSSETAATNAAKYARSIANPLTGIYDGYVGCIYEFIVLCDNQIEVNNVLTAIGGSQINQFLSGYNQTGGQGDRYDFTYIYSSTEFDSNYAYYAWIFGSSAAYGDTNYMPISYVSTTNTDNPVDRAFMTIPFYPIN